jgi:hypothetical protein
MVLNRRQVSRPIRCRLACDGKRNANSQCRVLVCAREGCTDDCRRRRQEFSSYGTRHDPRGQIRIIPVGAKAMISSGKETMTVKTRCRKISVWMVELLYGWADFWERIAIVVDRGLVTNWMEKQRQKLERPRSDWRHCAYGLPPKSDRELFEEEEGCSPNTSNRKAV